MTVCNFKVKEFKMCYKIIHNLKVASLSSCLSRLIAMQFTQLDRSTGGQKCVRQVAAY